MRKIFMAMLMALPTLGFTQTGNTLFQDNVMHEIRFTSPNQNIYTEMYNNHDNYLFSNGNKIYSQLIMEVDGNVLADSVGVRCKGETSFSQVSTDKKPFKVDINKFESNQKYEGLKKFNLHNARSDASMIRDKICYDLFREMGISAPRVSFAKVYINNEYWGVYSVVEQVDKTFLNENFGNKDGNLYKSTSGGSINFDNMELKTNEALNDFSKLNLLKDKITNTPDNQFEDTLNKYLNVDHYLTALAVDVLILDIDKFWYSGKNYYLYENTSSGKMEWVPWDYNLAMNYILDGSNDDPAYKNLLNNPFFNDKTLIKRIMENSNLKGIYLSKLCQLQDYFNTNSLFTKIDNLQSLIEADVLLDTKKPYTNSEFQGNIATTDYSDWTLPNPVPGVKQFITDRVVTLNNMLTSNNITCVTSVDEIHEEMNISVYPNPISKGDYIRIGKESISNGTFELYSNQGQLIFSKTINTNSIQLPNTLSNGIYFFKIEDRTGRLLVH